MNDEGMSRGGAAYFGVVFLACLGNLLGAVSVTLLDPEPYDDGGFKGPNDVNLGYTFVAAGAALFAVAIALCGWCRWQKSLGKNSFSLHFFFSVLALVCGVACAIGARLRRGDAPLLRAGLLGVGVFLLAITAASFHGGEHRDPESAWFLGVNFGVAALVLAATPLSREPVPEVLELTAADR